MESFKEINRENFLRSRFKLWKRKNERRKEEYFENKNEYK